MPRFRMLMAVVVSILTFTATPGFAVPPAHADDCWGKAIGMINYAVSGVSKASYSPIEGANGVRLAEFEAAIQALCETADGDSAAVTGFVLSRWSMVLRGNVSITALPLIFTGGAP